MAARVVERMVLYWLSGHDPAIGDWLPLSILVSSVERRDPDIQMHCRAAGVPLPSREELFETLQRLIDAGYVFSRSVPDLQAEEAGKVVRIGDPRHPPDFTFLGLTAKGEEAASLFGDWLRGDEGRRAAFDFVAEYVSSETRDLNFPVILPTYLPLDVDPLPAVTIDPGPDYVEILYDGLDRFRGARLIIEETTTRLPSRWEVEAGSTTVRSIAGISISAGLQRSVPNSPMMIFVWTASDISHRLCMIWYDPQEQDVPIGEGMRREALRVVKSMIGENQPTSRTPAPSGH